MVPKGDIPVKVKLLFEESYFQGSQFAGIIPNYTLTAPHTIWYNPDKMDIPHYGTRESFNLETLIVPRVAAEDRKKLTDKNLMVIRMAHAGMATKEIAEATGFAERTVTALLASDLGGAHRAKLNFRTDGDTVDIKARIEDLQEKALDVLEQVISGKEECSVALKVKTAQNILDRGGNCRVTKVEGKFDHGYMGRVGIELIKSRAKELGLVEEAEFRTLETAGCLP